MCTVITLIDIQLLNVHFGFEYLNFLLGIQVLAKLDNAEYQVSGIGFGWVGINWSITDSSNKT